MKRSFAYIILSLLLPLLASAKTPSASDRRFTFGAEWGCSAGFFSGYHVNYFSPEGWRVDERHNEFGYTDNGEFSLFAGYDIGKDWNIALYLGYTGIADEGYCLPVSVRGTRYFKENPQGDRWLTFVDLGSGLMLRRHPSEILTGEIGGGYRFSMNRKMNLDLLAGLKAMYSHKEIIYGNQEISHDRINRNNSYCCALSVSISLSF